MQTENIKTSWENITFGKSGRYFNLLYMASLISVPISIFMFYFGLFVIDDRYMAYKIMFVLIGVFFSYCSINYWKSATFFRSSVQSISVVVENTCCIKTFGGKSYRVQDPVYVCNNTEKIKLPSFNFLCPKKSGLIHVVIKCEHGIFYTAADEIGYSNISRILGLNKNVMD